LDYIFTSKFLNISAVATTISLKIHVFFISFQLIY